MRNEPQDPAEMERMRQKQRKRLQEMRWKAKVKGDPPGECTKLVFAHPAHMSEGAWYGHVLETKRTPTTKQVIGDIHILVRIL